MGIRAWVTQNFSGGNATDKKVGIDDSFANSQSLDFRKSPSQMSVLPKTARADGGVVQDLIQNEVMTNTGRIFAIGSAGYVYSCSTAGVWSVFGNVPSGTFGISYRPDQDAIYITGTTTVSTITDVSGTPTLIPRCYNISKSTYDNSEQAGFNVNSDQTDGTQVTTVPTTIVEENARYFQTDVQPIYSIGVHVADKGTGDWTVTVHDGLGRLLGSGTLATADVNSNSFNQFIMTAPIQVNVGPNNAQTYHWHVTSSNGTGTFYSTVANDIESADMELWANRLVATNNGMHPMQTFQQFETIGNGRYLSVWEPLGEPEPSNTSWQRQKLTFPPGYEVCGLAVFNEYLAIACERVTTGTQTPQEGIIFYWDGLSDTYNYFTKIPEGSPQAIHEYENVLWYIAGGSWYAITSVAATPTKIRRLPGSENVYTSSNSVTKAYPYSATVRYGIHLLGWPATTTNTEIQMGVYSWGRTDNTQKNAFGYSYILSTGSQAYTPSNNLTIGMVKNFGNVLHISWRDGTVYGVDVVDGDSTPSEYAYWESLIFDNGFASKQKLASYMEAKWLDIQDGVEIVLKYSIDRAPWVYSERFSNDNLYQNQTNFARFDIGEEDQEARFYEIQVGVDIYCDDTVTTPPVIVGVSFIYNDNSDEQLT